MFFALEMPFVGGCDCFSNFISPNKDRHFELFLYFRLKITLIDGLALYIGRRHCGLKLRELLEASGDWIMEVSPTRFADLLDGLLGKRN